MCIDTYLYIYYMYVYIHISMYTDIHVYGEISLFIVLEHGREKILHRSAVPITMSQLRETIKARKHRYMYGQQPRNTGVVLELGEYSFSRCRGS